MRELELHAAFSFNEETPLEDVLKYVKQVSIAPGGKGIEIYVDPMGLQEADKTMTSTIRNVEFEDVSVRSASARCWHSSVSPISSGMEY